jgi:hypothetical protein
MWLSLLIGGYRYVASYKVDKAIILKGPWPFAHSYFMETKEHLVIIIIVFPHIRSAARERFGGKDS